MLMLAKRKYCSSLLNIYNNEWLTKWLKQTHLDIHIIVYVDLYQNIEPTKYV